MNMYTELHQPTQFERHVEAAWLSQPDAQPYLPVSWFDTEHRSNGKSDAYDEMQGASVTAVQHTNFEQYLREQLATKSYEESSILEKVLSPTVSTFQETNDGFEDWTFLFNRAEAAPARPNSGLTLDIQPETPHQRKRFQRVIAAAKSIGDLLSPVPETDDTYAAVEAELSVTTDTSEAKTGRMKDAAKSLGSLVMGTVDRIRDTRFERHNNPRTHKALGKIATVAVGTMILAGSVYNGLTGSKHVTLRPSSSQSALLPGTAQPIGEHGTPVIPPAELPTVPETVQPTVDLHAIYQQVIEKNVQEAQQAQEKAAADAAAAAKAQAEAVAAQHAAAEKAAANKVTAAVSRKAEEISDYSEEEIKQIIIAAADKYGVSEKMLLNKAFCESSYVPTKINYNYEEPGNGHPEGLFQHLQGYWPERAAKYGYAGASIDDPVAQANVTAAMHADGYSYLWEC